MGGKGARIARATPGAWKRGEVPNPEPVVTAGGKQGAAAGQPIT